MTGDDPRAGVTPGAVDPATGIDERIAERRRAVRRERQLRRRRRTLVVGVTVVLLAVLFAIERSPLVGLERVEVVGTERLDVAEVTEAADLELGTSTLRLRLGAVEGRVTELPLVREASARRLDPLTVRIEVVERQPALEVTGQDGVVLADREGIVLAAEGDVVAPEQLLPVRIAGEVPAVGERPGAGTPLEAAVRSWRGLSGPLRVEVTRIRVDRTSSVRLDLVSGAEVRLGTAERLDEKVRALGTVLEDLDGRSVTAIDVTAPSRPAVEP